MSRRASEADSLILDFLDYDRPVGRTVVHRIMSDRGESQFIASRVRALEASGHVVSVKGDRLLKVNTPTPPPGVDDPWV